ncbi:MAG: DUF4241 domain-containing protein [Kineosporiaceae bacterium]
MTGPDSGGNGLWARITRNMQSMMARKPAPEAPPTQPEREASEESGPYSPDLDRLLTPGMTYRSKAIEYLVQSHPAGGLVLPTGRVVASDALLAFTRPFTVTVDPGTYSTIAWVVVLSENGEYRGRRVAALQLVVRDAPVARWEPALLDGESPEKLKSGQFFGYPVDTGMGCLGDLTALRGLATWDEDRLDRVLNSCGESDWAPVPCLVSTVTDEATGANIVAVASGWGDGTYPTLVGYTDNDQVACFVTDFMVVPHDPEK